MLWAQKATPVKPGLRVLLDLLVWRDLRVTPGLPGLLASKASLDPKASRVSKAFRVPPVWGSLLRVRFRLLRICLRPLLRVICGWWLRRNRRMAGCGMPRLLRGSMVARFRGLRVSRASRVLRGLRDLRALTGLLVLRVPQVIPVQLDRRAYRVSMGLLAPLGLMVLRGLLARRGIRVIRALMVQMALLVLTGRKVKWDQPVLKDQPEKTV